MKKFLCLIMCIFFLLNHLVAYEYELAICSIFCDDDLPYMEEWIDYHKKKGVEHFYLYNNGLPNSYEIYLKKWVKKNIIEIVEWQAIKEDNDWHNFSFNVQIGAYNHCLNNVRGVTRWLAIIDTDEFIIPIIEKKINLLMRNHFNNVSGLCINWQCYGTSHKKQVPVNEITKHLTMKMRWNHDWNKNSKCIVNPEHVLTCPNPHHCFYTENHWAVDSNYKRCDVCQEVNIDKIRINHYWTRDEYFLNNFKIPRYLKWGGNVEDILKHANIMNFEYDAIISN